MVGGPTRGKRAPKEIINSSSSFSDIQMDYKESGISDGCNLETGEINFPLEKNNQIQLKTLMEQGITAVYSESLME